MADDPARDTGVLAELLRLNRRLFRACLQNIADEDAVARPQGLNSMTFIFLHVVDARYNLAGLLGPALDSPLADFADVTSIDEAGELPRLAELIEAWEAVSRVVTDRVAGLSKEAAALPSPDDFPIDDPTILGAVAFLVQHESYHLGQLGLLRRQLGYPGMEWRQP